MLTFTFFVIKPFQSALNILMLTQWLGLVWTIQPLNQEQLHGICQKNLGKSARNLRVNCTIANAKKNLLQFICSRNVHDLDLMNGSSISENMSIESAYSFYSMAIVTDQSVTIYKIFTFEICTTLNTGHGLKKPT